MRYRIFSNCKLVKGAVRSTLCDLQHEKYVFLPNELADLFENDAIDTERFRSELDEEEFGELQKFMVYLEESGYVFHDEKDLEGFFPELSTAFHFPGEISNAIVEISRQNMAELLTNDVFVQLLYLGCRNIELRIFDLDLVKRDLFRLLRSPLFHEFMSVDLCIDRPEAGEVPQSVFRFLRQHRNIRTVIIFNPHITKAILSKSRGFGGLALIKGKLDSSQCGYISPAYFNINIQTYTESLNYNSCLNKKMGIDRNGLIKNCPSCSLDFGHISKNKLADVVIRNKEFKAYFDIHKDQIKVCRDCEFRHICTDCRVFLSDPGDAYSKPLKCHYDPYTTTWLS
jgi:SPASM domain peptide maturase of grasp-with-spasm system